MVDPAPGEVTLVLKALRAGDPDAPDRLFRLVYADMHRTATGLMRKERPSHTLHPSDLVQEACTRLLDQDALTAAPDRRYFFAAATRAMRQILGDYARRRNAAKREGGSQRVPLDNLLDHYERQNVDVTAMQEALDDLAAERDRASQVMTLRFLGGFTEAEVAAQLEVSVSTVQEDYRFARAWLRQRLRGTP